MIILLCLVYFTSIEALCVVMTVLLRLAHSFALWLSNHERYLMFGWDHIIRVILERQVVWSRNMAQSVGSRNQITFYTSGEIINFQNDSIEQPEGRTWWGLLQPLLGAANPLF